MAQTAFIKAILKLCPADSQSKFNSTKKSPAILVIFSVCYNFCNFASKIFNQLFNTWDTRKRNPSLDRRYFRAAQRLMQTSRGCDATACDGDLNIAHVIVTFLLYYKLSLKQST